MLASNIRAATLHTVSWQKYISTLPRTIQMFKKSSHCRAELYLVHMLKHVSALLKNNAQADDIYANTMGKEMPLERLLALCTQRAFTSAQQEPRAATTEIRPHSQLEGPPSSLLNVEMRFAQCNQMHHLNEGEELSSLTAALPHISPAQTKLMPPAHLIMTILLHSLDCC